MKWILIADSLHACDLAAEMFAQPGCFGLDFGDHLGHPLSNLSPWHMPPAGQRRQLQLVGRHESAPFDALDRYAGAGLFAFRPGASSRTRCQSSRRPASRARLPLTYSIKSASCSTSSGVRIRW